MPEVHLVVTAKEKCQTVAGHWDRLLSGMKYFTAHLTLVLIHLKNAMLTAVPGSS